MKKQILGVIIALSAVFSASAMAEDNISVTFDGKAIAFDEQPKLIDGSVMVPMRKIFEQVGADVSWDDETKTVTAVKNAQYVKFTADSTNMELGVCKDGKNTGEHLYYADNTLTSAPVIVNGSMLVPARAVSEAFYYDVNWDSGKKCVEISTPNNPEGWIYYASWTDGGHMYKIDTNGQNRQILSENNYYINECPSLFLNDEYLYIENNVCLYRIKTDGTMEEKITDIPATLLFDLKNGTYFNKNYIYFTSSCPNDKNSSYIYKQNIETEEITQLIDKPVQHIELYGDYIFFQYTDNSNKNIYSYYRMDNNGKNIIKVSGNLAVIEGCIISISNDKIHLLDENGKSFTAALDGSGIQERPSSESILESNLKKYKLDHIYTYGNGFAVGEKQDKHNNTLRRVVVNDNGQELFEINIPEDAYVSDFNTLGNKIYFSYELSTIDSNAEDNSFKSEIHCIDLDEMSDTIILNDYKFDFIDKSTNKMRISAPKYSEKEKRFLYNSYISDLDGNNIKEFTFSPIDININEKIKYGIIVENNNTTGFHKQIHN